MGKIVRGRVFFRQPFVTRQNSIPVLWYRLMLPLALHEVHSSLGARFASLGGEEIVSDYGNPDAEYEAIHKAAVVVDLGFRGRVCLTGADRVRLLNGQVTNDIKSLQVGRGCAAAFCSPKGRLVADVAVFCLREELLLDFEPGLSTALIQRLEHHIVAEDVQVVNVRPYYGLLTVQGPKASEVVRRLSVFDPLPTEPYHYVSATDPTLGDLYLMNRPRCGSGGLDLFIPTDSLGAVLDKLVAAAHEVNGLLCGFDALDLTRFEAGIPRFPVDMDETHLPPEAGLDRYAISYTKGCYTGQETIARLRTYGQVVKSLRGMRLPDGLRHLPGKGAKLVKDGREVGVLTSAKFSPRLQANFALGYVRREANAIGTELTLQTPEGECLVRIVELPFQSAGPAGDSDCSSCSEKSS